MKFIYLKTKELGEKDSQALREEYKECLESSEVGNKQLQVLYMN